MHKKKEITIRDLARMSGFSVATISRSLNNSPSVKRETKEKILKMADELGFECNASAKGLATSRVDTIGIILPPEYDKFGQQLYFSSLMNDLRESLERSNCDLIVSFATNRFTGRSHVLRLINRKKVDGLIILREKLDQDILAFMEKKNIPYIFFHYPPVFEDFSFDVVYPDHLWGGKLAGDHLASLGYKKIVCICPKDRTKEFTLRVEGFSNALRAKGIAFSEDDILYCPLTIEDGYRIVKKHVGKFSNAEALFAVTDLLALGAIQAASDLGLRIPEKLAIVGYDDTPLAAALKPALTSVHQPREEITRETCRRLMEKIERRDRDKPGIRTVIRPHLVVRESCGAYLRKNKKDFFLDKTRNKK